MVKVLSLIGAVGFIFAITGLVGFAFAILGAGGTAAWWTTPAMLALGLLIMNQTLRAEANIDLIVKARADVILEATTKTKTIKVAAEHKLDPIEDAMQEALESVERIEQENRLFSLRGKLNS